MRLLVVNVGSSSLKLRVLGDNDEIEADHDLEAWSADDEASVIEDALDALPAFDAIGHRVVHGGSSFRDAVRIDDGVEVALSSFSSLAPLHQPRAVAGIQVLRALCPDLPQVACFDTAFHSTLSAAARTYALPQVWRERWQLERFGFHGLSHAYSARRGAELLGRAGDDYVRVVTCHIGAGASLCATRGGRSVDTTMGFTPLEGLVMATRSGSVDPGLVTWLIQHEGIDAGEVAHALESDSGLAGLSGIASGDMRAVLAARATGDPAATLAFDVSVHRLHRELGSMIAVLGGVDAVVFTGGVGEHNPEVRAAACATFGFAGVGIDHDRNSSVVGEGEISGRGVEARVFVVTAREDLEIARQVRALLDGTL